MKRSDSAPRMMERIPPIGRLYSLEPFQGVSFFLAGTCARRIASTPGLRITFQ